MDNSAPQKPRFILITVQLLVQHAPTREETAARIEATKGRGPRGLLEARIHHWLDMAGQVAGTAPEEHPAPAPSQKKVRNDSKGCM